MTIKAGRPTRLGSPRLRVPLAILSTALLAAASLPVFSLVVARIVERRLPPQGRFVTTPGGSVHFVEAGEGPPIVIVPGLGAHTRNFTFGMVGPLSKHHRVLVMDRPGAGYSRRAARADAGLAAQAGWIASFVHALGLERPLLVGHSLGGTVALATALDHPGCVGGLALISPLTQPEDVAPAIFRGLAVRQHWRRRLVAWTVAIPMAVLRYRKVTRTLFGPEPAPADFHTRGGGLLGLRPASVFGASTDLVQVARDLPALVARYGSLRLPVGVLFGRQDRILDAERHGGLLATQIPDLELEWIDGGGHMTPMTAPSHAAAFAERTASRIQAGGDAATDPA